MVKVNNTEESDKERMKIDIYCHVSSSYVISVISNFSQLFVGKLGTMHG